MKRYLLTFIMIVFVTTLFSQRRMVSSALGFKEAGNMQRAFETIQDAVDPNNENSATSINWARTWEVRGEILQQVYRQGLNLIEQPLFEAFESYKKAVELDEEGVYFKSLSVDLKILQTDLSNLALESFESEKYDVAMHAFEKYMEISSMPILTQTTGEIVDTAIIYNTALAAFYAENWDKAIKYFMESAKLEYNGAASYHFAFQSYTGKGDFEGAISALEKGHDKYPTNEVMLVELIKFFMNRGNNEKSIEYIDDAIENNPRNLSLYMTKGNILEEQGDDNKAIETYEKVIEIDKNQYLPYVNIGVLYYNKGISDLTEASALDENSAAYDQKIKTGKDYLRRSMPYLESALALREDEIKLMNSLRIIYYRLQLTDKYRIMDQKIKGRR